MDHNYSMTSTLSATAIAQNTAFIAAIKDTETIRDKALQVTQRMSGSITFEGHRSIAYSKLRAIFSKYGKRFEISFQDTSHQRGVHIDCYELLSHSIPHPISLTTTIDNPKLLADSLANFLDATTNNYKQSGSIIRFSLSLDTVTSQKLEAIFSLQILLDIFIYPDHLAIDIILPSDNKGGLSDLKMNRPNVFMLKKWTLPHTQSSPNQTSSNDTIPQYTPSKNTPTTTSTRRYTTAPKQKNRARKNSTTTPDSNSGTITKSWPFLNRWF